MNVTIEEVQALVRLQLGKRTVADEDRLVEDLGAESADLVNIMAAAEDRFGVSFEGADISKVRTVHELFEFIKR